MPDNDQEFRPLERVDKSAGQAPARAGAGATGPIVSSTEVPPRRRGWRRVLFTGPVIFLGWISLFIAVMVGAVTLPDIFRGPSQRPRSQPAEPERAPGEPSGPPSEPERSPRKNSRQDRLRPPQLQAAPVPARGTPGRLTPPPPPPPVGPSVVPPPPPVVSVTPPPPPILTPEHDGLGHINGHDNGAGVKMGHFSGHGDGVGPDDLGVLVRVPGTQPAGEADAAEAPDAPVSAHHRGLKLGHDKWHGRDVGTLVAVPEEQFAEAAGGPPGNGHGNAWGHTKH
ncbi:MAG TPA: hypothetical protein VG602_10660 [Actinomycetota bacterium]|nr:hypothetical protein [Actinomycetota bacterium]